MDVLALVPDDVDDDVPVLAVVLVVDAVVLLLELEVEDSVDFVDAVLVELEVVVSVVAVVAIEDDEEVDGNDDVNATELLLVVVNVDTVVEKLALVLDEVELDVMIVVVVIVVIVDVKLVVVIVDVVVVVVVVDGPVGVVVVSVMVVREAVVVVHSDPSTKTATIGLYPSGPLEPSGTLLPKLLTWARSAERYKNGDFSSPAMNLDSTPPPLWVTIWATNTPTDAEPPSWPSNRALHTVAPPTPWVQTASTSRPKLPFVCSTSPPTTTSIPWRPSCTQPFSVATSKYRATRAESTGPLPLVCRLARRLFRMFLSWCRALDGCFWNMYARATPSMAGTLSLSATTISVNALMALSVLPLVRRSDMVR